jgi:hypothetical protein
MNRPILRLSLLAALLGVASLAAAAPPQPRQPPSFEQLAQALALRPEQMAPVREAFEAAWARRAAERQSSQERRQAEREAFDRQLATLLSEEQRQRLQRWRESRPKPGAGRRMASQGAAP